MYISKINNDTCFKNGLYFSKSSHVLFNQSREVSYLSDEIVKKSPTGARYIENTGLSQEIKDAFSKIPFVKNLAEKFDTFIWFSSIPRENSTESFLTTARIMWADYSKSKAEERMAFAESKISEKDSFENLIDNINNGKFM